MARSCAYTRSEPVWDFARKEGPDGITAKRRRCCRQALPLRECAEGEHDESDSHQERQKQSEDDDHTHTHCPGPCSLSLTRPLLIRLAGLLHLSSQRTTEHSAQRS